MLAPATALKVNQSLFTLFTIGMMFFPSEMMQGYSKFARQFWPFVVDAYVPGR